MIQNIFNRLGRVRGYILLRLAQEEYLGALLRGWVFPFTLSWNGGIKHGEYMFLSL